MAITTARKRSLRMLCFHRCLSVHRQGCLPLVGGEWCLPHTPGQTLPPSGYWDTHPLPSACWDTYPPAQCMLGYGQQAGGTHPTEVHCWDTVNKRVVRIPLRCILVANASRFIGPLKSRKNSTNKVKLVQS